LHQVGYDPGKPIAYTFFRSVPALNNYELTLRYQQGFVNQLLSHSLRYPHVLYCMNNETQEPIEWGDYWARYVRARAAEAGKRVEVAEMRRHHDITSSTHRHMINHPDLYSFLDVSQNNWEAGQTHWDRILQIRALVQDRPRPINNNTIYSTGNEEEAVARMFRIIFAGGASARFHRPHPCEDLDAHEASTDFGLRLSPRAQAILRAARTFTGAMNVFACQPQNDLLSERSPNEAYCLAEPGKQYAVYFPNGGQVTLDISAAKGTLQLRWLDIARNAWHEPQAVTAAGTLELKTPGKGHWAVLVQPERKSAARSTIERFRPWPDNPDDGSVKEALQPWPKSPDGRYDLARFEPRWEDRPREFLPAVLDRRIVVALGIWDDWPTSDPGASLPVASTCLQRFMAANREACAADPRCRTRHGPAQARSSREPPWPRPYRSPS
jgi:hypothetical protein